MCSRSVSVMPATGSSSSSSRGRCTSTIPISSHCFWPCDSEPAVVACVIEQATVSRPRRTSTDIPRRRRSSERKGSRKLAAMSTFSSTVSSSKTDGVWNVRPTPSRTMTCSPRPMSSLPAKIDRAVRRAHEPGDRVDERRLAGPVGADDEAHLVLRQVEVETVDGVEGVECDVQTADLEQWRGSGHATSSALGAGLKTCVVARGSASGERDTRARSCATGRRSPWAGTR